MMHSPMFGVFPIKPGYISLNFCVALYERKGELYERIGGKGNQRDS